MSAGISGTYDGEGPNVATNTTTNTPDVGAGTLDNAKGQGRQGIVTIDRRRRLRTSSESARASVAIGVGGGDQKLTTVSRGIYVSVAGNLVCRLADDAADATFVGLAAGQWYPFCVAIVRQTGTTISGVVLF